MAKEYIWFKHFKNRNSIHRRNKKVRKAKMEQLLKDGWIQIKGEKDRTPVSIPKPKPKPKPKAKKGSEE